MKILIKLGGSALIDQEIMENVCREIAQIKNHQFIIVHGGGPFINQNLKQNGISWDFYQGNRITDDKMMSIIESTLSGQVNKMLVREFSKHRKNVIGLSGVDNGILRATTLDPKLDRVGKIEGINSVFIESLLKQNQLCIISPIALGFDYKSYNVNADWAAMEIAKALKVDRMIYLSDIDGILDDNGNILNQLNQKHIDDLVENEIISGGMYIKVKTILSGIKDIGKIQINNTSLLEGLEAVIQGRALGTYFY